jgi:hypothetical protein
MVTTLVMLRFSAAPVPMVSARPVAASRDPKMMPVPKRMIVPQSIFAASVQVRVASRFFQFVGG